MTTDTTQAADATTVTADDLVSLPPELALAAIDQVIIGVRKDDSRPVLTGVLVETRAGEASATFTSADGFRLITVTVNLPNPCESTRSVILDARTLKATLPAIKAAIKAQRFNPDARIVIRHAAGSASVDTGASTMQVPVINGTFPNYQALIPTLDTLDKHAGSKIAMNGALIGEVFERAAKYAGSGIVRMRVQDTSAPVRLDWQDEINDPKWTGIAVIMPMFVKW